MDPVFIVGVPRSGTTLLRVILDSHPNLAVGPECPWISGNYGDLISFRHLYETLISHKSGPIKNLNGVTHDMVASVMGNAINEILQGYAQKKKKQRWLEKTPDNIAFIPFLNTIFPNAKYIHIIRDGRDVACSSFNSKHNWGTHINCNEKIIKNTIINCLKRWNLWVTQFQKWIEEYNLNVHELKYEDMIVAPQKNIEAILEFINEPWSDNVLNYQNCTHDLPTHEMGTQDVISKKHFSCESIGRWKQQFSYLDKLRYVIIAGKTLKKYNYL
jgi:protein-tyrosine sulfotransferase